MCGCVCTWGNPGNCVGILVICVLVFNVFCFVCTLFLYRIIYVYLFLFLMSALVCYCHRVKIKLQ